jgi:AraC-like DNA-binding protein
MRGRGHTETAELSSSELANVEAGGERWQGRWYLWDGGFLTMGRASGVVPPHAHHALQITLGLDGPVRLSGPDGGWGAYRGAVVAPDVEHRFDPAGALIALLFVDPESHEGRWLRRSFRAPVAEIPAARLEEAVSVLRGVWEEPVGAPETARLLHAVVRGLCAGPPPPRPLDARIVRALEVIRRMGTGRVSLDDVARAVFLSPSRFAHLFREEVGLPFRRYLLWRRLTCAMLAVGRGRTLSAAAHACGFADAAHLTRSCSQMFGMPPSVLLRAGEFHEIPAPFELPYPPAGRPPHSP